ncbi:flagellar hook-associated protein 3 [Armatimonadetes bacterium Uphvl-Ar1]|nr:flagellar hook-associated protein 3 [Armatimonadetes bacterium Uphvl-Ar1]
MRISTGYQFDTYTGSIRTAQEAYFKVQKQISSGKRFESAHEDPLATKLTINSRHLKARFDQFEKNLRGAKDYMGNSERGLTEIGDLLSKANVLAIQGASSSIDANAAQSLAQQVASLQEKLVRSANMQGSQGQYIFAGHQSETLPFTALGGVMSYAGDANVIRAEVRSGEYMPINLPGVSTVFTDIYDKLETLKTNIQNQNVVAISDESLADIKSLRDQITGLRAEVGSRMQTIESLSAENTRRIDDFSKEISDHEDVDLAEAFVRYQQSETAYTAAMQIASQGMRLSLMDFMR